MPSPSPYHVTHLQPKTLYLVMDEPGRRSDMGDLTFLKHSILADGLKTPLRARLVTDDRYKIIHGRRRYMAIMELIRDGHKDRFRYIPCNIARSGDEVSDLFEYVAANRSEPLSDDLMAELRKALIETGLPAELISLRAGIARSIIERDRKASRKPSVSLASRLTPRSDGAAHSFVKSAVSAGTITDLLASICAVPSTDPSARRVALRFVGAIEEFIDGQNTSAVTAKTLVTCLTKRAK